jgi:hypothetical protein
LKITFSFAKDGPGLHAIKAVFSNKLPQLLTGINLQIAVQKYMKLQIMPASGTDI